MASALGGVPSNNGQPGVHHPLARWSQLVVSDGTQQRMGGPHGRRTVAYVHYYQLGPHVVQGWRLDVGDGQPPRGHSLGEEERHPGGLRRHPHPDQARQGRRDRERRPRSRRHPSALQGPPQLEGVHGVARGCLVHAEQ